MNKLHSKEDEEFLKRIAEEIEDEERIEYEGEDFTEYFKKNPNGSIDTPLGKIHNTKGGGQKKKVRLILFHKNGEFKPRYFYRAVYENYHKCKLPSTCDIHHIDENPFNCHISNLRCIDHGLHTRFHHLEKKVQNFDIEREALVDEIKALKRLIRKFGEDLL